ncbi:DinB family protein [Paracidobacterium acidisoli]|uniref:Damage-inducible protein DinB n=1 Tax=Paracidobacterium acidisoli TaxID=2303751 RepID=A0A372IQU9_9BACT|nr:DinB family protein [Paracidobacterium acidisoli]MBT9330172.1 DinB family protein [Paracidobacterium acidisoli]
MKMTDLFLDELAREANATRRALERIPDGRSDWKPHPKSMSLGQLATLVSSLPSWIVTTVNQEELDMKPAGSPGYMPPPELHTSRELVDALEKHVSAAQEALEKTNDRHLMMPWRFKVGGMVVSEEPRYQVIRDSVFNHLAHHRGQLTVYLRLNDASVPSIYGPSADDGHFG